MLDRVKRVYMPMTETGFYILFSLQEERHGYSIIQHVRALTGGELVISAGTMYGSLSKMERDGLIVCTREQQKRRLYLLTPLGQEILAMEQRRIARMYRNSRGETIDENEKI